MIPLLEPNLSGNEARYLRECIDTGFVSSVGPFVDRFEEAVASAAGAAHAISTASGTAGLHAALVAVGVGQGDLVILPSWTFIASANAIHQCGATPWLFDVCAESWTLDAADVARALAEETHVEGDRVVHSASGRRVAAAMPVYTLGLPADMQPLLEVTSGAKLPVVADAAAAIGARYRDQPLGALGADLSVFSFNGNKTLTSGGGGAIFGQDPELCALVKHLTTTARISSDYEHDRAGFNYRMTNLQAAVGLAQIEQVDAFVATKRAIDARYAEAFRGLEGIERLPAPAWAESACWLAGGVLTERAVPDVVAALAEHEVSSRAFWRPMHLQAPYRDAPRTAMHVTDAMWRRVITLPCSTHLSEPDQGRVIEALSQVLAG
jgi:perosamine synthetase